MGLIFSDYLTVAWFLASILTVLSYLWIAVEIGLWPRRIRVGESGFKWLLHLFQGLLLLCAFNRMVVASFVWDYPTHIPVVVVTMAMAVTSGMTAAILYTARPTIQSAFVSMFRQRALCQDR